MEKIKINAALLPWGVYFYLFFYSFYEYLKIKGLSNTDEPLLYATALVVLWIERESIVASVTESSIGYSFYGLLALITGLVVFIAGKLYPVIYLEILGLFIIASGIVVSFAPVKYLRSAVFIGIGGTVLVVLGRIAPYMLSSELAKAIASLSAKIISAVLFPVTSDGVVMYFGPYSAEVSHACSGMNSIFSLLALSVIYLREGTHRKYWHIGMLVAFVLPVAMLTNLIRVIILVLITWYFGDRYAQGIYHDMAGIMVFVIAMALLAFIDRIIYNFSKK